MSILKNYEKERIVGSCCIPFYGCFMQQNSNAILSLNRLLDAVNFTNIIELGTLNGGLSTLLALYCFLSKRKVSRDVDPNLADFINSQPEKFNRNFYTFDCRAVDKNHIEFLTYLGATFEQVDFLNNEQNIEKIGSIIKSHGGTLLLCDGGDKIKEMEIYSKYLKVGDFIMAHDYARDEASFQSNKQRNIWFHKEVDLDRIQNILNENSIQQIFSEEFDDAVWFCGVKR